VIATTGRPTLARTLESIECLPGDEILVVGNMGGIVDPRVRFVPCPPGGDWGHSERNFVRNMARGNYVAHIDDDDWYAPHARELFEDAIRTTPNCISMFRMQYPHGLTLWREKKLYCGNLGTPMFLLPNIPSRFGTWAPHVGGDFIFLEGCKWREDEIVWRPEVTVMLGHN
jgi:hypothetical protein